MDAFPEGYFDSPAIFAVPDFDSTQVFQVKYDPYVTLELYSGAFAHCPVVEDRELMMDRPKGETDTTDADTTDASVDG